MSSKPSSPPAQQRALASSGADELDPQTAMRSIRLMSEAMGAFHALTRVQLRYFDLTPAQFDIIATLGNTEGMNFSQLGQKTLATKGTLTGIVDRMVKMGLVERVPGEQDRRTILVRLTAAGDEMFDRAFPAMLDSVRGLFVAHGYRSADFAELNQAFIRLRQCFEAGQETEADLGRPSSST